MKNIKFIDLVLALVWMYLLFGTVYGAMAPDPGIFQSFAGFALMVGALMWFSDMDREYEERKTNYWGNE